MASVQDELSHAHGCAQNGDPLRPGSLWGSPLHTLASESTRSATVCSAWTPSGTSPLLKTQVLPNSDGSSHVPTTLRPGCCGNPLCSLVQIEESHEPFTLIQTVRRLQECSVLTKGEEEWHQRVPLFTPLTLRNVVSRTEATCPLLPSETTQPSWRFWR